MEVRYFQYIEIGNQRYSQVTGIGLQRWMSEVTRGRVDNENNSQSQYLNILIMVQGGGLYIQV